MNMNRSIVLASLMLAGFFSTLGVQAAEPATSSDQAQMCREVRYKQYSRVSHGPPGKSVEIVKVTPRIRTVCNDNASSKRPARSAAVMRHYKSA
jgi:hypothetical protein